MSAASEHSFLKNILLNKAGVIIQIFIAFIITPILVNALGSEKYGIWTIIAGLSGYLSLLDFGISSAIIRFVSHYHADKKTDRVNAIVSTSLVIFLILGTVLILFGPLIAHYFVQIFTFPENLASTIKILIVLVTIDVTVFVLNGVFRGTLEGQQRFDISAYVHVAAAIYKAILCVVVLHFGFELIALTITSISANVFSTLFLFLYIKKKYKNIHYKLKLANKKDAKKITLYGKNTFVGMIANQIIYYSDTFIIAFFMGASAVAFYAIPWSLMEYMRQLFFSASRTFVPSFSFNEENTNQTSDLYIKGTRLMLIVTNLLCIGMIIYGEAFIKIWIGAEYANAGKYLVIIFFFGLLIQAPQMISYSLLQGLSKHKIYSNYSLIMSAANLILSIIFVQKYGLIGVAIGAAIPQAIFYGVFVPLHTHKKIHIASKHYFIQAYLPHVVPCIILISSAFIMRQLVEPSTYTYLILNAMICTFSYLMACFIFVLSKNEKQQTIFKIKNLFNTTTTPINKNNENENKDDLLVFITSIRHPINSNNYSHVLKLFEMTAKSVCQQTDSRFKFIVVCNERPNIDFKHPNIIYHVVDFPPPSNENSSAITLSELKKDKGTKLLSGSLLAQELKPSYIFYIDADDWLNIHITSTILNSVPQKVWYVNDGYLASKKFKTLKRVSGITRYCGSCFIYHNSIIESLIGNEKIADKNSDQEHLLRHFTDEFIFEILGDHAQGYFRSVQNKWQPKPLKLLSICWVVDNGENHSKTQGSRRGIPLSSNICYEFGLDNHFSNNSPVKFSAKIYESLSFIKSKIKWTLSKVKKRNIY